MKHVLFSVLSVLISQSLLAGDAGYFSRTCLSTSQRTVLTILSDYTENSSIYTLIVDGVPAIYNLSDKTVKVDGDDGVLTISKSGVNAFKSDYNADSRKMELTIYNDPRSGTIAEHRATPTPTTVQVQCKDFWPNP